MAAPHASPNDNPRLGIAFIVVGMSCVSINDMLVKQLSDGYPLHQTVFLRSIIGICVSLIILQFEGGFPSLRTRQIGLHVLRCLCLVFANMAFFAGLAVIPLADSTALFFVAPLFITLLSIPFLGEKVGVRRIGAVAVGFLGVLIIVRPGVDMGDAGPSWTILLLPVAAAFAYACMQILTRRLGAASTASAMSVYTQSAFIVVGLGFWAIAGDGRFAEGVENKSLIFLLRAWAWPTSDDWVRFGVLGLMSGSIGYCLSRAYRSADAAVIAPFEYVAMPLAILLGWAVFGELPDVWVIVGAALIIASGVYVFLRERKQARPTPGGRKTR